MKRVLVITYYWPPEGGSGVQRWVKFTKYLRSFGWEPVIYTPSNPERGRQDPALAAELPEGLEVLRTPIREPYAIYRKLTCGASTQITELSSGGKKTFGKRLSLFVRGNFFIPDPRRSWVRPSVKYLERYLKEHPADAVVTTGPPHSVHLIGLGLKRRTGVPWVADFRDPWTRMFYFKDLALLPFARRAHLRLEQSVLDGASAVVAVSGQVRDDFALRTRTRIELITNGYDAADFEGPAPARDRAHFRLVHTGMLGSDGNPSALWKVLSDLSREDALFRERLQVRLCGKVDSAVIGSLEEAGLGGSVENLGYLDHASSIMEQRSADLLLLPLREGAEGGKIVPGKVFEYLASRRPVLGIGAPSGSAAAILKETGSGCMCSWDDVAGIREAVLQAWRAFLSGGSSPVGSGIEKYSRQALTGCYAELLDSLS